MGANAVIAVDLDYETISTGSGGNMLMVTARNVECRAEAPVLLPIKGMAEPPWVLPYGYLVYRF